ncbi:MAG: DUF3225 domain-containing protein [Candidatus Krumholzibacteriota bacterium]|nr:DUF3225 domain-containing protein [Candidatus Krumholzibacteriota bacterium]
MKRVIFALLLAVIACTSTARDDRSIRDEIRIILDLQTTSWNEGKLERYMRYYWNSDKLTFFGGKNRQVGWDTLEEKYRHSYPPGEKSVLTFSDIDIQVLSDDYAYALGSWKVEKPDTVKEGLFTVIFRRCDEGWRIIHDHSS